MYRVHYIEFITWVVAMIRILIAGGRGFIGQSLSEELKEAGHEVAWLSRQKSAPSKRAFSSKNNRCAIYTWEDLKRENLPPFDVVVNLCGANILTWPWTKNRKKQLLTSRVKPIEWIDEWIELLEPAQKPSLWINASAIGVYPQDEARYHEEQMPFPPPIRKRDEVSSFLEQLALEWETAFSKSSCCSTRKVACRLGVVLDRAGGMLLPCSWAFYLGLGGNLGSGVQYFPWISLKDVTSGIKFLIDHPLEGAVNFTAPTPCTNANFTKALAKALKRYAPFPVPSLALKTLLGERSELLLKGCQVIPQKLMQAGYTFHHPEITPFLCEHFTQTP